MRLDNDLLDLWLKGLLVPAVARPLLEDVQGLRDRLGAMKERLAGAAAQAGELAEELAALEARLEEATRHPAGLEAERAHHLGNLVAAADGAVDRTTGPTARG